MADGSLLQRKPRKSNFSTDEVDVLVESVRAHHNILYGKYAKRATNRWIRQKAWMDILRKVNGVSVEKRTLQEVKNKWKKCQYVLKEKAARGALADEAGDSSWEDVDSMPLQERLSKVVAQEKIAAAGSGHQMLKSQPLSPTKLKVTRQSTKAAQVRPAEPPQSPANEEMCLRWNSHHSNMQTAFPSILLKEQYVDVTLAAEGKTLKCHRLILSSCSPYFEEILSGISPFQHPVLFMRDIPFWILKSLCDFMYAGEVHIYQNKLEELLTVAEALKIKGLAGKSTPPENHQDVRNQRNEQTNAAVAAAAAAAATAAAKEAKKRQQQERERVQHQAPPLPPPPPPLKKNPVFGGSNYESTSQEYDNEDLLDPLDLLEPLYEEAAEEKKPIGHQVVKPKENKSYQYQPIKKPFTRRLRKRKYSEQRDPSPPPVFSFRKGTRSRPNVKIPKYYHSDYSQGQKVTQNSQTDPLLDVDEIKTEPIDVEDNLIDYSDEENQYNMDNSIEPSNSPIIITSTKPPQSSQSPPTPPPPLPPSLQPQQQPSPPQDKFKKIKLSKPIITEVHTIEETNTTAGGLEVIKITVTQPIEEKGKVVEEEEEAMEEEEGDLLTENGVQGECQEGTLESDVVEEETEIGGMVITQNVEEEPPPLEAPSMVVEEATEEAFSEVADDPTSTEDGDGGGGEVGESTNPEVPVRDEAKEEEEEIKTAENRTVQEEEVDVTEEERRTASLDHLEKEAMNVANAINKENQEGPPPDIE